MTSTIPMATTEPETLALDLDLQKLKWGWACRLLPSTESFRVQPLARAEVGDVLVARVESVRHHTRLMTACNGRVRMYRGDLVVGVLGHRYATDAFEGEAEIEDGGVDLLTNAGMFGQVRRRHASVKPPTRLEVVGALACGIGRPVNLIERAFSPRPLHSGARNVIYVLGTGMNAGKTTAATKLVRGLLSEPLKVAALKLTGSVSPNDRNELEATGAAFVRDFSDYGFPSTHLQDIARLRALAETMLADAAETEPDVVVVELADGVLQRETEALIRDPFLQAVSLGALLAAPCALSALKGVEVIRAAGLELVGVTGLISNAPLFIDELEARCEVPVLTSADDGETLGAAVSAALAAQLAAIPVRAA